MIAGLWLPARLRSPRPPPQSAPAVAELGCCECIADADKMLAQMRAVYGESNCSDDESTPLIG
ncbi:hypothetical protein ACP70R_042392 [Stipagrostis hirtigluma subsp. patula]